jgi:Fe2+ transport system protein FeoA
VKSAVVERESATVPAFCKAPCADPCPLLACARGGDAIVLTVDCPYADASRLRALGVFEGARVTVIDDRYGLLLRVRGARLALGRAIAASITVLPVAA